MRGRTFTLLVLLGINTMNFYDRQIFGAVAQPIKEAWQLTDLQVGHLGTAFTLLYAAVGLPLGHWADVGRRRRILAGGVALWSLMTALSGMAWSVGSLFAFRLGVGVGEASCAPAANSLLGDLYPPERRARAISTFMVGLPLGLGLGFVLGGWIGQEWGWRAAFLSAGLPGLLLGLLALATVEPPRGTTESRPIGQARRPGSALLNVLRIPTMWWIIASGALHNFNMYALGTFLSPLLQRYYGLSTSRAGLVNGLIYGVGGSIGMFVGGWACDRVLRRRGSSGRLQVAALGLLLFVPCVYLALQSGPDQLGLFAAWLLPACTLSYVYYAGVYPTIQDIVEPSLRGTAMALYFFAMYLLGASLGPVATGWASDFFARRAAALDGSATVTALHRAVGLRDAMGLVPLLGLALVVVVAAAAWTVKKDAAKLQAWMKTVT